VLGRTLGSYRLEAHIGSGGMGVVYRGEHTLIGRKAAVKVLLPEYSTRQDLIRRFFNEAKAAASAQHPGIVEVYDFGQTPDGIAYLVMELLEGDTLWQRLRKGTKLPERQALLIARQIAAALAAAHQAGVIHRDLKPGNIFLLDTDEPGGLRVKLMDFGVAKLMREDSFGEGLTTTGAIVGTPTFMSPEQCRGGGTPIDWRSDIYSLGCILFSMLCGRPPFVADGSGAVLAMHIYEPIPRVKDFQPVSDEVDRLVYQLLSKRPEDRAREIREVINLLADLAPTEEGRRGSAPLMPTVMEDDGFTAPQTSLPPGVAAFSVPASAVPALRENPVAFPRPATTLRSGTPVPAAATPAPVSASGPLAPTLRKGKPGLLPPGGGVAAAVAVTVPAAAAAPTAPPVIAGIQVVGKRSETPAGWPEGTPTAQTTIPPRARSMPGRPRSAGPLVAVVLAIALFGGSLFAAFRFGVFGGRQEEEATAPAPAVAPRAETPPARSQEPAAVTVVKDSAPPPVEVEPAAAAEPEPAPVEEPAASPPPPARIRKRVKKIAPARQQQQQPPPPSSEDNVIDPFR
jgi:serine/threonine-protein kinase